MKIQANGTQIHVSVQGGGDLALVFLHYYGGSSRTWRRVADELNGRYQIVAVDHRGWGESDAPETGYGIADLAADAEAVIDTLGLKRYVLIGHSMGGKVAQLLASRHSPGLEGLVLVAPAPPLPVPLSDEQRRTLVGAYQSRASVEYVIDHVLAGRALDEDIRQQVIDDSLKAAPQAKAAWPEIAMQEDISAAAALIKVPTLILSGELDKVDPAATLAAVLLPLIAHATMDILPGVGHLSPLEAPHELARHISAFIARLDEAGAAPRPSGRPLAAGQQRGADDD